MGRRALPPVIVYLVTEHLQMREKALESFNGAGWGYLDEQSV